MTKKFEKGCAVDVRGLTDLPYGEAMFNAIKRIGDGVEKEKGGKFECANRGGLKFLSIDLNNEYLLMTNSINLKLLTPTDILGEHLVKAIEGGYKPWFEGDEVPDGLVKVLLSSGKITDMVICNATAPSNMVAYRVTQAPSIQEKPTYEELVEKHLELSIKYDNCATKLLEAKTLSEKVGSTSFLLLSEQSHNDLLNIKASAESIKKSDCEIAKALMREVFKELIDELDNKEGE